MGINVLGQKRADLTGWTVSYLNDVIFFFILMK